MASAKNPWMKFFPADWRADPQLRLCGLAARGLWAEMLCLMHTAEPYGHLVINGRPLNDTQLANLCGVPVVDVAPLLRELEDAGVFSRTGDGILCCRRMIRDEQKRLDGERAARGGTLPTSRRGRQAAKVAACAPPPRVDEGVDEGVVSEPPSPPEARGQTPEARCQKPETRGQRPQQRGAAAGVPPSVDDSPRPDEDGSGVGAPPPDGPDSDTSRLIAAFDAARTEGWGDARRRVWPAATDAAVAAAVLRRGQELGLPGAETVSLCTGLFRQRMATMQGRGQNPPQSLRFFEQAMADVLAAAVTPLPPAVPSALLLPPAAGERYPDAPFAQRAGRHRARRGVSGAAADYQILCALGLAPDGLDPG
ncbi:hypothetical protein [Novispirillum itersonii]|uniref:Uncharacterized protein n=1 Tax=Novispirillum itersonii TaxID=189 RepID=A0A7W9ZJH6_NOVIT|nr:hypothetical protein [Novispirillum itersonii]MBB6211707.1 hypothetical protein [Novispirillum itersonii]